MGVDIMADVDENEPEDAKQRRWVGIKEAGRTTVRV